MEIKPKDVISQWMKRWAAMLRSRFVVGRNGRTVYERRKGRKCTTPVAPFGERVLYKEIRENKDRTNKFDNEWKEGVWLGHARQSNVTLIGTKDGVVRAYAVSRREEGSQWSGEVIREMRGTPGRPNPNTPGSEIPIKVTFDVPEQVECDEAEPRRR